MSPESPRSTPLSLSKGRQRRRAPRVPAFHPVPLRATHHGWTPERQAHFIGWLAETGSVAKACVGRRLNYLSRVTNGPRIWSVIHVPTN